MGVDGAPLEAHELPSGCQVQLTVLTIPRTISSGRGGERDQNLTPDRGQPGAVTHSDLWGGQPVPGGVVARVGWRPSPPPAL